MTATKAQVNGYGSILNSLREHKDRIDRAIEALEALQDSPVPATDLLEKRHESSRSRAEPYAGLQFIDAVTKLLNKAKAPLTTSEITEALLKGGFSSDSEHPKKVVAAQLHRYADNGDSGIVKAARGLWSLAEESSRKSP